MSTSGSKPVSRLSRATGWARKAPAKRVGGPVAAVAFAVSGLFGGWAPVAPTAAPEMVVGKVIHTGPLEVSFLKARAIDDLKPFASPTDGNRFLLLIFKVRNVSDLPVSSLQVLSKDLELDPEGAELDDNATLRRVLSTADLSDIGEFQPGLEYEAAVAIETQGQDVVRRVAVGVPGYTWRAGLGAQLQYDWRGMEVVARGEYPVKDVPDVEDELP